MPRELLPMQRFSQTQIEAWLGREQKSVVCVWISKITKYGLIICPYSELATGLRTWGIKSETTQCHTVEDYPLRPSDPPHLPTADHMTRESGPDIICRKLLNTRRMAPFLNTWKDADVICSPSCMFCCSWFCTVIFFSLVMEAIGILRITVCSPTTEDRTQTQQ